MSVPDEAAPALPDRPTWHYIVAFVAYVGLGLTLKSVLLNWIVGPFFLVLVFYVGPRLLRRVGVGPRS